ncbi:hypothetical protein DCAR_0103434 [Daucus carota subsp. sativus]|uniref:Uncharacterized protein n=1 Tax=Daucus carota subsp. sativus TaxID=79200 RepID=A0A166HZK4_DAUCS|nr:PREDICTED: uncharacterized protein LOC108203703 [Daucus carota subsp. sativus]WOG84252.1 hypothetical protein DCAR_0103434 [Daucus carota subsp. sativus]
MVQRKLGIQADHVASEKGSSPSQNQDNMHNKGADLKKRMKKTRSAKLSGSESLGSIPPSRKNEVLQTGKPPTSDHVKTRAATPLRQSPVKAPEESPNYMKSTSCFDARKEQSQVSPQTPQSVVIRKSTVSPMKSNNSRHSSDSDYKTVGGLARTSNLKLVRTLTKTPSFKPARASTKKYSPIALCEEFDVQKPTCSSTLKDSKFPTYLELSSGATESEGTSAMKVCPYTYCSLNGHHHAPVPPLKSFLAAKRRVMKAQKIMKLGCLSPRRAKSSCLSPRRAKSSCLSPRRAKSSRLSPRRAKSSREPMIKIEARQVILAKIPPTKKKDFSTKPETPLMHEKKTDHFVNIYSNDGDGTSKGNTPESLIVKAPCSVVEFENNPDQSCGKIAMMNDILFFNQNGEASADIHPVPVVKEDTRLGWLSTQSNSDEESQENSQHGQSDADASDMEWEAGYHCEPDPPNLPVLKVKATDVHNGSEFELISKPINDVDNSFEDMLAEEVGVGSYDEKSVSSGVWSVDSDSDMDGLYTNMFFGESCLAYSEQTQGRLYLTTDALDDSTGEEDGLSELIVTLGKEITSTHHTEEFQAASEEKKQVPESSDEASQEQYVSWLLQNHNCNLVQDFKEQDQDETHDDYNKVPNNMVAFQFDLTSESRFSNVVSDESFPAKTKNEEAGQEEHDQKISIVEARDGIEEKEVLVTELLHGIRTSESLKDCEQKQPIADAKDGMEEKEQLPAAKSFIEIQPFEILQEFSDPIQDIIAVSSDQSNQTEVSIKSKTNQTYAEELAQDQTDTCKFTRCKYSEDQKHSGGTGLRATPNQSLEPNAEEGEFKTEPDTAETSLIVTDSTNTQKSDCISNASSESNGQALKTVENSGWTYGSRKSVAELEDIRDFNPREPNYLPVQPDPESEKVDLRHQMIDERRNAEEWMVDYALRQAVTKLAPARKRKVSLLVEAFEKVLPTPKYETQPRRTSPAFVHAGTIQACR